MKKRLILLCLLAFVFVSLPADAEKRRADTSEIKYVFYMIGDGMGINPIYGAQTYNQATGSGPAEINFLKFPVRTFVTTHSKSSLVTDSAAAGTALASGKKVDNYTLGTDQNGKAIANIAEWAEDMGYGTGVATSVGINHATPSAFYAHESARGNYGLIIGDYINGDLDFLAGGGIYGDKGSKAEELEKDIAEAGIRIFRGDDIKNAVKEEGRVLCMNEGKYGPELKFAIDRKEDEISLADFVRTGIGYLDKNFGGKGFFFMVEGGLIDYTNHSNDTVGSFHEINDFAAAVDMVLEFYRQHPEETLIIVTADHDTGGFTLGKSKERNGIRHLAWQKESENILTQKFNREFSGKALNYDEVKDFLRENLSLWESIKADEDFEKQLQATIDEINRGYGKGIEDLYSVNSKIIFDAIRYISNLAGIKWISSGHTGSPLGLFVLGPGAEAFMSCRDNTDIPKQIAKAAGYRIF